MKASAIAPSNIAFIKYWGIKDKELRLPANGSISMNLSNLLTTTTVEFGDHFSEDVVIIDGKQDAAQSIRVSLHLDRIRKLGGIQSKAKVVSENNFPTSTGLSSSAAGFAALTAAAAKAASLDLSEKELSILARLGSGSACRSIPDGITEWIAGESSESSYAVSLYPPDYWEIMDVVAVISREKKEVSTSKGHTFAQTSPFFGTRLENVGEKIRLLKKYLAEKDFSGFGELVEAEALELHAIMMTSKPSLVYLRPETIEIMRRVREWRGQGLSVYFSLNTGQDIHIICQKSDFPSLQKLLSGIPLVRRIIPNHPAVGAHFADTHLF